MSWVLWSPPYHRTRHNTFNLTYITLASRCLVLNSIPIIHSAAGIFPHLGQKLWLEGDFFLFYWLVEQHIHWNFLCLTIIRCQDSLSLGTPSYPYVGLMGKMEKRGRKNVPGYKVAAAWTVWPDAAARPRRGTLHGRSSLPWHYFCAWL